MVDLHCHILPGIDDGSKSLEQSMNMIREAKVAGFDTICCTSHYLIPNYVSPREENEKLVNLLREEINKNNIDMELKLANEVMVSENMLGLLEENLISTIEGTNYLLMELPLYQEINFLDYVFDRLQNRNIRIVLAHPERYKFVQDDPNRLIEFIENGIILQSNYASILGKYGPNAQKTIIKMLKSNMVNLLATDTHRDKSIYTHLDDMNEKISKVIDDEYFELITETVPRQIINNEEIQMLPYKKIKKFFFL